MHLLFHHSICCLQVFNSYIHVTQSFYIQVIPDSLSLSLHNKDSTIQFTNMQLARFFVFFFPPPFPAAKHMLYTWKAGVSLLRSGMSVMGVRLYHGVKTIGSACDNHPASILGYIIHIIIKEK